MQCQSNEPPKIPDDLKMIMDSIDKYFGNKSKRLSISLKEKSLQYVLYNSFEVRFELGERYGEFGAGIVIGSIVLGPELLPNRKILMDSSEEAIANNLKIIDDYCKLRLPDKFIKYHGWE